MLCGRLAQQGFIGFRFEVSDGSRRHSLAGAGGSTQGTEHPCYRQDMRCTSIRVRNNYKYSYPSHNPQSLDKP